MSTPRTDALRAKLAPLAESLSADNFGEVSVKCIAEFAALCCALERELAEARATIAYLFTDSDPESK